MISSPSGDLDFSIGAGAYLDYCSPIKSFDGVVPVTTLFAQLVIITKEFIPFVYYSTVWKCMRGPRPEGQVCSTARNNILTSNSAQRCRSNDYCPCRRIILFVEDSRPARWIFEPQITRSSSEQWFFGSCTSRYQWCCQLLFLNYIRR
ncbi:hypothetical protein TNCV_4727421 [Trichonephila clavipes]|nr:hypothetical protein TNCV_4727421 [Trichonephila clavipes]